MEMVEPDPLNAIIMAKHLLLFVLNDKAYKNSTRLQHTEHNKILHILHVSMAFWWFVINFLCDYKRRRIVHFSLEFPKIYYS